MENKTAVEWLHSQLDELEITKNKRSLVLHLDLRAELFNQAKAMEKEQIIEAVNYGFSDWGGWKDSEEYYTSTYE